MKQVKLRVRRTLTALSVTALSACSGIFPPASVDGLREVVGDELPGARGQTLADQEAIDSVVARGCATGLFTRTQCEEHTAVSYERRRELRGTRNTETETLI